MPDWPEQGLLVTAAEEGEETGEEDVSGVESTQTGAGAVAAGATAGSTAGGAPDSALSGVGTLAAGSSEGGSPAAGVATGATEGGEGSVTRRGRRDWSATAAAPRVRATCASLGRSICSICHRRGSCRRARRRRRRQ